MLSRSVGMTLGNVSFAESGAGVPFRLLSGIGMKALYSSSNLSTGSTPFPAQSFSQALTADVNLAFRFSIKFIICFWL